MNSPQTEKNLTNMAETQFIGKKIVGVRYMTNKEAEELDWFCRPLIIELDDGNLIVSSSDDEGNGPGVILSLNGKGEVFPVIL